MFCHLSRNLITEFKLKMFFAWCFCHVVGGRKIHLMTKKVASLQSHKKFWLKVEWFELQIILIDCHSSSEKLNSFVSLENSNNLCFTSKAFNEKSFRTETLSREKFRRCDSLWVKIFIKHGLTFCSTSFSCYNKILLWEMNEWKTISSERNTFFLHSTREKLFRF